MDRDIREGVREMVCRIDEDREECDGRLITRPADGEYPPERPSDYYVDMCSVVNSILNDEETSMTDDELQDDVAKFLGLIDPELADMYLENSDPDDLNNELCEDLTTRFDLMPYDQFMAKIEEMEGTEGGPSDAFWDWLYKYLPGEGDEDDREDKDDKEGSDRERLPEDDGERNPAAQSRPYGSHNGGQDGPPRERIDWFEVTVALSDALGSMMGGSRVKDSEEVRKLFDMMIPGPPGGCMKDDEERPPNGNGEPGHGNGNDGRGNGQPERPKRSAHPEEKPPKEGQQNKAPRDGRNPQTGEEIRIPEKRGPDGMPHGPQEMDPCKMRMVVHKVMMGVAKKLTCR